MTAVAFLYVHVGGFRRNEDVFHRNLIHVFQINVNAFYRSPKQMRVRSPPALAI